MPGGIGGRLAGAALAQRREKERGRDVAREGVEEDLERLRRARDGADGAPRPAARMARAPLMVACEGQSLLLMVLAIAPCMEGKRRARAGVALRADRRRWRGQPPALLVSCR